MPLYEYKCSKCGSVFEVLQKFNENPLKKCIACGGTVKKVITSPAIQFKGSGWYVTDYAQKENLENKPKDKEKQKKEKSASKKDPGKEKKGQQSTSSK